MDSCYLINNNRNNEQEEMNKYLNCIENIKNLRSKDSLLPCDLHEQIPLDGYDVARCSIKMFFSNNLRFVNYGYSSGSIRIHSLYRGSNGVIYVVHTWCGTISDIYYFTKGELYKYFEGYENEIPDFKNPEEVEEYLDTIHTPPSVD